MNAVPSEAAAPPEVAFRDEDAADEAPVGWYEKLIDSDPVDAADVELMANADDEEDAVGA